jgi:hypothetical protein
VLADKYEFNSNDMNNFSQFWQSAQNALNQLGGQVDRFGNNNGRFDLGDLCIISGKARPFIRPFPPKPYEFKPSHPWNLGSNVRSGIFYCHPEDGCWKA